MSMIRKLLADIDSTIDISIVFELRDFLELERANERSSSTERNEGRLLVLFFFHMREEVKMGLSSESFDTKTPFFFLLLLPLLSLDCAARMSSAIADCDGLHAFSPPPTPAPFIPEDPPTPPEAPPVPQPVVIPQLEVPLLWDPYRSKLLYDRYCLLNFGGNDDIIRMVDILKAQF